MKTSVDFRTRYDPTSDLFQLEVQPGVWSAPIEIERIGRIIRDEALRRRSEPKERDNTIPVFKVLSEALLNSVEVKKIPASGHKNHVTAEMKKQELLNLLGL